ncbi:MAG: hypothetical protein IKO10_07740 [Lachnospiraceae bacterium]|nr:hypothetical protein [Lachnospiraceae bacterium]
MKSKKRAIIEILIVGVILIFCELFFMKNRVYPSTDALFGDRGDGRLTALITEHWWNVFSGKEHFLEIAMFYPMKEALGYSDLLLGYGIVHSIFRILGIEVFMAYKYTMITIHVMGIVTMYCLLRYVLKCHIGWSLFGTIAFCFSNTYANCLSHTQLNAISYLPLLLIFCIGFVRNFDHRRTRNIYAYLAIAWFVLLTYTSWYIACFTGIFSLIFLVIFLICSIIAKTRIRGIWKAKIGIAWKDMIGYLVVMVILFIPFIVTYIPVLKASSGYTYDDCAQYLPEWIDIINVSDQNLLMGGLIRRLGLSARGYSDEVTAGFSIILLGLFVGMFLVACRNKRAEKREDSTAAFKPLIFSAFITVMTGILIIIKWNPNGASLWWFFYSFVPVAGSMRAIARFMFWLSFPMAVITSYAADHYLDLAGKKKYIIQGLAVILIFVSNISITGINYLWGAAGETGFMAGISQPPVDAEVFYIIDSSNIADAPYIYQMDAYEIADHYHLKTINGYSGQFPNGWMGMWDVNNEKYESSVYNWIDKYDLQNVYAYDRATDKWIPLEERNENLITEVFCPEENSFSLCTGLEEQIQREYSWTSQEFQVEINNERINDVGLEIKMRPHLEWYLLQNPLLDPQISVYVDGEYIQNVDVTDDMVDLRIPMTEHADDKYTIEIKTNCYFVPKEIGMNDDTRQLSLELYYIGD